MKKFFLLLILCMLFITSCQKEEVQAPIDNDSETVQEGQNEDPPAPPEEEEDDEEPAVEKTLTFALFSDLHNDKFYYGKVMDGITTMTEGKELDGLILLGDIVYLQADDIPSSDSYKLLKTKDLYVKMKEQDKLIFTMGNHEFPVWNDEYMEEAKAAFLEETGHTSEYVKVIEGYNFITVGPDSYAGQLSAEQEEFAMNAINNALSESRKKPVFLLVHHPIDNSLYGTENYDYVSDEFEEFVKSQPRLIVISAHTHYPLSDPKSILQMEGGSTFLYSTSLMGGNGLSSPFTDERHSKYPSQAMIIEINNKTNVVTFKPFYAEDSKPEYIEKAEWTLDIPAMIKKEEGAYKYTEKRSETSAKPTYAEGAEIIITKTTNNSVTFTYPAAIPGDESQDSVVAYYKIELFDKETGDTVLSKKIISDFFVKKKKDQTKYVINDLEESKNYIVAITPINAWYVEGDVSLEAEFKTVVPKFKTVPLDEETTITRGIFDSALSGSYTKYTDLIHIAGESYCSFRHYIDIDTPGTYRLFLNASAAGEVNIGMTASYLDEYEEKTKTDGTIQIKVAKSTELLKDNVSIDTGDIFKFEEFICGDITVDKPGKYMITFKKNTSANTVGITDFKIIKHK